MIKIEVFKWYVYEFFPIDNPDRIYCIPPYQRNYAWEKSHWEELFNDIMSNDEGYFLGTVMCIPMKDKNSHEKYQIVDGQQRITTLLILYATIYAILQKETINNNPKVSENKVLYEMTNIKQRLIPTDKEPYKLRLSQQPMNTSKGEFKDLVNYIINGLTADNKKNEPIFEAHEYFFNSIEKEKEEGSKDLVDIALTLINKLNKLLMIMIVVDNEYSAYTLFESLNNKGLPLSIMDIIKSKMFHADELNGKKSVNMEAQWKNMLSNIDDSPRPQERFLRHFFQSHLTELMKLKCGKDLPSMAKRSNLVKIYEDIIKSDYKYCMDQLVSSAKIYKTITNDSTDLNNSYSRFDKAIVNLNRIEGAPAHQLILYLLRKKQNEETVAKLVEFLVSFFVRRSITDKPSTRTLDKLFVEQINSLEAGDDIEKIYSNLESVSAKDDEFRESLQGNIYKNKNACRLILCSIEENLRTPEDQIDLWGKDNKNKYQFEIEHILPQGKNIPDSWIKMIADGDENRAKEYQQEHVHKLGNLTLTKFNKELRDYSFIKKRDSKNNGEHIGYKNNLKLNESLKNLDKWTVEEIKERTRELVEIAMKIFKLSN